MHLAELRAATSERGVVKRTRTGWVQRLVAADGAYFAKTYVYPSARDRRRGFLRNTWLAKSRAAREANALAWLRAHGFTAPRVVVLAELRRLGVLHAALVVTEAIAARTLEAALPMLASTARDDVLRGLRAYVRELHHRGFRDRNLDLRNILWLGGTRMHDFVKIDSPRFCVRRPGDSDDRLAREDWRRLDASLATIDLSWPT